MKRIIGIVLFVLTFLIPISVFASDGGFNLTGTSSMQKDSTATFTVAAYNSAGRLTISSSNPSVATVSNSDIFVDSNSPTFTVTAVAAGTTTITVSGTNNYATFDSEDSLAGFSRSITVTVTDPNANNNNNGGGSNPTPSEVVPKPNGNNNNNNNSTTTTDTTDKKEEKKEEKKSSNSKVKELSVEKYTLTKINDNKYELTVENDVDMITIKAEADDSKATIKGTGMHELVVGENKIEVTVTAEDGSKNVITILVTREEDETEKEPVVVTKVDNDVTTPTNKFNIIPIVMTGLDIILGIAVISVFIKNKKLKESINQMA